MNFKGHYWEFGYPWVWTSGSGLLGFLIFPNFRVRVYRVWLLKFGFSGFRVPDPALFHTDFCTLKNETLSKTKNGTVSIQDTVWFLILCAYQLWLIFHTDLTDLDFLIFSVLLLLGSSYLCQRFFFWIVSDSNDRF